MTVKEVKIDQDTGLKQKQNVKLLELIKNADDAALIHTRLPSPYKIAADMQKVLIKKGKKMLILIKDNTAVRHEEKTYLAEKF